MAPLSAGICHNGQCCFSKKVMSSRNLCLVHLETSAKMLLKQLSLKWTDIGCSLHFQLFKQLWFAVGSVKGAEFFNTITIYSGAL